MNVTFTNPETGAQLTGTITRTVLVNDKPWALTTINGVDWAVPQGWPNNQFPVCRESDPEAYAEIEASNE